MHNSIFIQIMPRTNENRVKSNNSTLKSAFVHETDLSVINTNALNMLITLKGLERTFSEEINQLELDNPNDNYSIMRDEFYNSYSDMMSILKVFLSETTEINLTYAL